jgi:hypothetical protein
MRHLFTVTALCMFAIIAVAVRALSEPVFHVSWEGASESGTAPRSMMDAARNSGMSGQWDVANGAHISSPEDHSDNLMEEVAAETDVWPHFRIGVVARWLPAQSIHGFTYSVIAQQSFDHLDESMTSQSYALLAEYVILSPNPDKEQPFEISVAAGPTIQLADVKSTLAHYDAKTFWEIRTQTVSRNSVGIAARVRGDWYVARFLSVMVVWEPVLSEAVTVPAQSAGTLTVAQHDLKLNQSIFGFGLRFHIRP